MRKIHELLELKKLATY